MFSFVYVLIMYVAKLSASIITNESALMLD